MSTASLWDPANPIPISGLFTDIAVEDDAQVDGDLNVDGAITGPTIADLDLRLDTAEAELANISASGAFAPSFSNLMNASAPSFAKVNYIRVGNVVTGSFYITVTVTGAGNTRVDMSVPISTTTITNNGAGSGCYSAGVTPVAVIGVGTNNLRLNWTAPGAGSITFSGTFCYEIN